MDESATMLEEGRYPNLAGLARITPVIGREAWSRVGREAAIGQAGLSAPRNRWWPGDQIPG